MNEHEIVLCTCPDLDIATKLAETLVQKKLAACVNILPGITSIYEWKGETETGSELLLLIKTSRKCYKKLEKSILDMHPYELPEIISVPISNGFQAYLGWIDSNTEQ